MGLWPEPSMSLAITLVWWLTWLSFFTGWVDNEWLWPLDSEGPPLDVSQEAGGLFGKPDPWPFGRCHTILSSKHFSPLFSVYGFFDEAVSVVIDHWLETCICVFFCLNNSVGLELLSAEQILELSLDCLLLCLSGWLDEGFHPSKSKVSPFISRHFRASFSLECSQFCQNAVNAHPISGKPMPKQFLTCHSFLPQNFLQKKN